VLPKPLAALATATVAWYIAIHSYLVAKVAESESGLEYSSGLLTFLAVVVIVYSIWVAYQASFQQRAAVQAPTNPPG